MKRLIGIGAASALVAVLAFAGHPALANTNVKADAKAELRTSPLRLLPDEASVSIGAGGTALVRGAQVDSIEEGVITATTEWDNASITWTVVTDSGTEFVGSSDELSDIDEGDEISFSGELTSSSRVEADTVRLWSDERSNDDRPKAEGKRPFWSFFQDFKLHWGNK